MHSFWENYWDIDILLVNNIKFIEWKEYIQEKFFHIFNTLHEAKKKVLIALGQNP